MSATAFAIYSADDNSLTFYKNTDTVTVGSVYNNKTATAVYTGIEETAWTSSTDQAWSAYRQNITNVSFVNEIKPTDTSFWFYQFSKLTNFNSTNLNTENTINMYSMFNQCSALTTLDVSNWNISKVIKTSFMFSQCTNLLNLDISNWDVSSITNPNCMFQACEKLTTLDVSNWDTSAFTTLNGIFYGCKSLPSLNVSNWDTSNVTNMRRTFGQCFVLTEVDVSNWNTGNVTTMEQMFYDDTALTSLNIDNWNMSQVTDINCMFAYCSALTTLNASNWDTSNVTNMYGIFCECSALTTLGVSNWDTGNVTNMSYMFYNDSALTTLDVSRWDTSKVADMSYMFYYCPVLTILDVSNWNTENVTNMSHMFYKDSALTTLDVSNWNTSKVTDMSYMFTSCFALTILDVSNWNTENVTNMNRMFIGENYGSTKWQLTELNVRNWNTSKVTDMAFMFYGCKGLSTIDVTGWDTIKVTTFDHMFAHTGANIVGVENFNTGSATTMYAMFHGATNKTIDVSNFNTSKVITLGQMFENCWSLTEIKGLENFDTSNCIDFVEMFQNCYKLKVLNLSNFDTSKAVDGVQISGNGGKSLTCKNMFKNMRCLEKIILGEKFRFDGSGATTANIATLPTPSTEYIEYADGHWYSENGDMYAPSDVPDQVYGIYYASPYGVNKKYTIEFGTLKRIANVTREKTSITDNIPTKDIPDVLRTIGDNSGIDTSDATATAGDILSGKTAYVNGSKITGVIESQEAKIVIPSADNQVAVESNRYTTGDIVVQGDSNLAPENIKAGVSIFGIEGNLSSEAGDAFEQGKQAERTQFWNVFQNNGGNQNVYYAYAYDKFDDTTYNPIYSIICTSGTNAGARAFYSNTKITDTKVEIYTNSNNADYFFSGMTTLVTVPLFSVQATTRFTSTFANCKVLQNLTMGGTIGMDIDLSACPLSKTSIESVITHLSDSTSGKTAKFKLSAVNVAFETSEGAKDGSASTEWNLLVNGDGTETNPGKTNWTITLV